MNAQYISDGLFFCIGFLVLIGTLKFAWEQYNLRKVLFSGKVRIWLRDLFFFFFPMFDLAPELCAVCGHSARKHSSVLEHCTAVLKYHGAECLCRCTKFVSPRT